MRPTSSSTWWTVRRRTQKARSTPCGPYWTRSARRQSLKCWSSTRLTWPPRWREALALRYPGAVVISAATGTGRRRPPGGHGPPAPGQRARRRAFHPLFARRRPGGPAPRGRGADDARRQEATTVRAKLAGAALAQFAPFLATTPAEDGTTGTEATAAEDRPEAREDLNLRTTRERPEAVRERPGERGAGDGGRQRPARFPAPAVPLRPVGRSPGQGGWSARVAPSTCRWVARATRPARPLWPPWLRGTTAAPHVVTPVRRGHSPPAGPRLTGWRDVSGSASTRGSSPFASARRNWWPGSRTGCTCVTRPGTRSSTRSWPIPTYEMGALLAGLRAVPVPVDEEFRLRLSDDAVSEADAATGAPLMGQQPRQPGRATR